MTCNGCLDAVKRSANVTIPKKFTDLTVESIDGDLTNQVSLSLSCIYLCLYLVSVSILYLSLSLSCICLYLVSISVSILYLSLSCIYLCLYLVSVSILYLSVSCICLLSALKYFLMLRSKTRFLPCS